MAVYAPAGTLIYLESDRPFTAAENITTTEAWSLFAAEMGVSEAPFRSGFSKRFIEWTGIGPVESVVFARSQIAVVITDLGAVEEGETLRIKPEGVLIVETHTAEIRIRSLVQETLQRFAAETYDRPTFARTNIDGVEYLEWTAPDGARQIVAVVRGSVAFIGNSRKAVQLCLTTSDGRSTLREDPELRRQRSQLKAGDALAFGYVSPQNSARLLSIGLPLLFGRAPGDADFQRVIGTGAAKLFGSLAWSCRRHSTGFEDRYSISLQPEIVKQLSAAFGPGVAAPSGAQLPQQFISATHYRFQNSLNAWQTLRTTVSSHVDALSAVLFSSILKSALLSYGIADPEGFLQNTTGEIVTVRMDEGGERTLLITTLKDKPAFRQFAAKSMGLSARQSSSNVELLESTETEMAAAILGEQLVVGSSADVQRYVDQTITNNNSQDNRMRSFSVSTSSAQVVTYTDDGDRVRAFVSALRTMNKVGVTVSADLEPKLARLPFSITETTLTLDGFERVTRSPLGQFGSLLALLVPDRSAAPTVPSSR